MRRKKNDKRVLISRKDRKSTERHRQPHIPVMIRTPKSPRRNHRNKRTNGMLVLIVIIALIGFVIGVGLGVSLTFDNDKENQTQEFVNVTKQMLNNNSTNQKVYFEKEDEKDYNKNQTEFIINTEFT